MSWTNLTAIISRELCFCHVKILGSLWGVLRFKSPPPSPNNFCTISLKFRLLRVSYVSHRVVQGALRTMGQRRRRRRSRFNFPAAIPPPPQSCWVPLIFFLWVCLAVLHRERQITSGAAAMGPNTAPANTTERHTHTHKRTLDPACPKMLLCGGTKEFVAHS